MLNENLLFSKSHFLLDDTCTWWYNSLLDLHVQYDLMQAQIFPYGINHIPSYVLIVQSISHISTHKIYAIFLEVAVDVRGIV